MYSTYPLGYAQYTGRCTTLTTKVEIDQSKKY